MYEVSEQIGKRLDELGWPKDRPKTLGELIRELPTHSITCYGDGEGLCRNWDSLEEKYEADTPEDAAGLALEALLKKEKGE